MEVIVIILILFIVGVAACLLLSSLIYVGLFAGIGLVILLLFATCVETKEVKNEKKNSVIQDRPKKKSE